MKFSHSLLALYLALSLLFSLNSIAENEPNNDIANANPISLNSTTNGSLSSSDDVDYYKITTTVDGRLSIDDNTSNNLSYYTFLYDEDGKTVIKYHHRPSDNSGSRVEVNLSPGIYYIKIDRTAGNGSYTLNPSFEALSFAGDNEPNDTYKNADALKLNKQNTGNLGSRRNGIWDNDDFWKITILKDGRLTIKDTTESHLSYYAYLYDSDGKTTIKYHHRPTDNSGSRISVNLSPGIYYLKMDKTGYNYSAYGSYTIFPEFVPTTYPGDIEPNDVYTKANKLELNKQNTGNLGNRRNGIWDNNDYWKITILEDGRLTIKDTTESHLSYYAYLYDSDGKTTIKYHHRPTDNSGSRISVNLSPGVYYLKMDRSGYSYSTYGSYTILPEFIPTTYPGDLEPNDVYTTANKLKLNKQNTGNLGSRRDGIWDENDYWKITILEDGRLTIKDTTESHLSYYTYLYDSDSKTTVRYHHRPTDNSGSRISVNLSPGIYYLKMDYSGYNYSTYGSYTIFPEFVPTTYPGDIEPNDVYTDADVLKLNKRNTGNLGNRRDGKWDNDDFWKITIPEDGRLTIKDTTESHLSYYTYLYDSDGKTTINYHHRPTDNSGSRISVNLSPGVYYLKMDMSGYNYSTYGSYTIFPDFTKAPKADFEFAQDIRSVSFTNTTIDGENYKWDFDDGETSEQENPSHIYVDPGEYMISLIASNLAGEDTASKKVIIYGIKGVSPQEIGNNGEVTLTIKGGGFSENSIVKISKDGGAEIEAIKVLYFDKGAVEATFRLENVSLGSWDVKVDNSGKPQILEEDVFNIVPSSEPKPWVNLSGRSKVLFNRWQTYTLEFGNTGNVDADLVPVWITISDPEHNEIEFLDLIIAPSDYMVENGLEDQFNSIPNYIDIDTLWGEAKPTRVYSLLVPKIPAGYSSSIQFRVKTGTNIEVHAWNNAPLMTNGELAKCQASIFGDCLDEVKNASKQLMYRIFGKLPGMACITAVTAEFFTIGENYSDGKSRIWGALGKDIGILFITCASEIPVAKIIKLAMNLTSDIQFLHDGIYKPISDCMDKFDMLNHKTKKIRGVTSFDPNEMVGPSGYGDANYITTINTATYTVFFENKSSASAPAQEIWIKDTLDLTKFNIDLFSFNKLTIGDREIKLFAGQKEFSVDVDFRPKQELIGRVVGKVNIDDGSILVYFNSLDPTTMRENEDPDLGVLLPNINSPEGEGNISFSVGLINPTNGMSFDNEATIVFDYNDPIITNKYSNTIDNKKPTSKIESYTYDEESREITLNLSINDKLSGIDFFILYVSKNDSSFVPLMRSNSNSFKYIIEDNIKYKFYSVATDKVGNMEEDPDIADINFEVLGNTEYDKFSLYNIYPNPVQGMLYIDSQMKGDSFIEIIDLNGKTVITRLMKTISGRVNLTSISRGVYYIRITNDEHSITKKIIVE